MIGTCHWKCLVPPIQTSVPGRESASVSHAHSLSTMTRPEHSSSRSASWSHSHSPSTITRSSHWGSAHTASLSYLHSIRPVHSRSAEVTPGIPYVYPTKGATEPVYESQGGGGGSWTDHSRTRTWTAERTPPGIPYVSPSAATVFESQGGFGGVQIVTVKVYPSTCPHGTRTVLATGWVQS